MMIIGCDLHTPYRQIAMLDQETFEVAPRSSVCHTIGGDFCTCRSSRADCGNGR